MRQLRRLFGLLLLVLSLFYTIRIYHNVQRVLSYRPLVHEVLTQHAIHVNEDLILALIYTETRGKSQDVMQASESVSGAINTITDSRESIRQGATLVSEHLATANDIDVDIWTAIQAYNFGTPYLNFVAQHGGQSTIALAKRYSQDVVAPSLGNVIGETYPYYSPVSLIYGGGELYQNGGNIYYAKEVRFHLYLIKFFSVFY
ncbi:lysozyme family protein [Streptococcus fryi]